jgi:hypothetical protein
MPRLSHYAWLLVPLPWLPLLLLSQCGFNLAEAEAPQTQALPKLAANLLGEHNAGTRIAHFLTGKRQARDFHGNVYLFV